MTTTAFDDQFVTAPEPVRQPYDTEAILRRNVADLELALKQQTERAESYAETLRSLASYVGAGGYNADTVDAGVFEEKIRWGIGEIMARLEKAEAEVVQLQRWKEEQLWIWEDVDAYARERTPLGKSVCETALDLMKRAEAAEAELAKLREQKPVRWHVRGNYFHDGDAAILFASMNSMYGAKVDQLFAAPVPVPHKGATHCDDCGLTWLDDGLNPLRCPYCKDSAPAPAVPTNTIPEGDDFNGTTPHMIQCIESLVSMNDRGALVPHGLCGHSRTLLLASANRLRQQQAHVAPAVPVYLLERQENGLSWYIGATTCFGGAWHWTADVNSAIRFSREEDAAACWNIIARHHIGIGGSGTTETTPKQHIFDVRTLLQSAEVRHD